jgi:CPA2 family monovalent cation:H+ antiporter-2
MSFIVPYFLGLVPEHHAQWINCLLLVVTLLLMAPFLRAMIMKKNKSMEFKHLWLKSRRNRAPLIFTILVRIAIALGFIYAAISTLLDLPFLVEVAMSLVVTYIIYISDFLKYASIRIERLFIQNLRSKDYAERASGKKRPLFEGHLLDRDIHISLVEVPHDSMWAGKTLKELNLGNRFKVHVSSIIRGYQKINIPSGDDIIFPLDQLNVIGTDDQLRSFNDALQNEVYPEPLDYEGREMQLRRFIIREGSPFIDKSLITTGLRDTYNCMLVGMEMGTDNLAKVNPKYSFKKGDILWIVGEENDIKQLAKEI